MRIVVDLQAVQFGPEAITPGDDALGSTRALAHSQRRTIPEIVKRLRTHGERDRRLFWLAGIIDLDLALMYTASTCLIAASEGEGFGLPLIEAAQAGLPIIARDIPVFREVAGDGAFYSNGQGGGALAEAIREWFRLYRRGSHPDPARVEWLTWAENARRLTRFLVHGDGVCDGEPESVSKNTYRHVQGGLE